MPIPNSLCGELATILGGTGQSKSGICEVEVPRKDLSVTILGIPSVAAPTHMIVLERNNSRALETGDLVLLQDEVPGVVKELSNRGIIVSAIHNHWLMDDPHLIYLHIEEASMDPREFARRVAGVLAGLDQGRVLPLEDDKEEDDDE